MAHPCRLCKSTAHESYGPFFHKVWCTNDKCPQSMEPVDFFVQWQQNNDPVPLNRPGTAKDFVRKVIRIWRPNLTRKQLNNVLYGLSEEAKDLLYP